MNKYLFNLPRPSIPIFVRESGVAAVAAAVVNGNQSSTATHTKNSNDSASFTKSDIEFPIRRGKT